MKKYSLRFHRNDHEYLGNHPTEATTVWSENGQGLAHDDNYWYITNDKSLFKYKVTTDLDSNNYFAKTDMPQTLKLLGYEKFKAPAYHDGYLYIPMAGEKVVPIIAVYRAEDLSYLNHTTMLKDRGQSGWCAINPKDGRLYTSSNKVSREDPIYRYVIVQENEFQTFRLEDAGVVYLHTPCVLQAMQGGVFSPDGLFYLINGYFDKGIENAGQAIWEFITPWEVYIQKFDLSKGGISVYGIDDFAYQGKSSQNGGFRFQWDPNWKVAEEPEGITFWDLDDPRLQAPHIQGQLHAMMIDNDETKSDDAYIKHYRISLPKPITLPWLYLSHRHAFDWPNEMIGELCRDMQGVAHDEDHWFFSSSRRLWKVPLTTDLSKILDTPDSNNHIVVQDLPAEFSKYDTMGDIICVNGMLLVPIWGSQGSPLIAAFRADNLRLVDWAYMEKQSKAPWCAVRALDQKMLYSSDGGSTIHAYSLELTDEKITLSYKEVCHLKDFTGKEAVLRNITGGEISMVSGLLYLIHDNCISVFHTDGSFVDSSVEYGRKEPSFYDENSDFKKMVAVTLFEEKVITLPDMEGEVDLADVHILCADSQNTRFTFKHFQIEQPMIVGNRKTMEMHIKNCFCERKMNYKNKVSLTSVESGLKAGYNGCYYCLRSLNKD